VSFETESLSSSRSRERINSELWRLIFECHPSVIRNFEVLRRCLKNECIPGLKIVIFFLEMMDSRSVRNM
jgi:hypothetical protein